MSTTNAHKEKLINRAWKMEKHAADTLASRTNFFLLAESFLVLGFTQALTGDLRSGEGFRALIVLLGMIVTTAWIYVNGHLGVRVSALKEFFREDQVFEAYDKEGLGLPSWFVLDRLLPTVIFLFWPLAWILEGKSESRTIEFASLIAPGVLWLVLLKTASLVECYR